MKKLMSLCLASIMLLSMLSVSAAAETTPASNLIFDLNLAEENGALVATDATGNNTVTLSDNAPEVGTLPGGGKYATFYDGAKASTAERFIKVTGNNIKDNLDNMTFEILLKTDTWAATDQRYFTKMGSKMELWSYGTNSSLYWRPAGEKGYASTTDLAANTKTNITQYTTANNNQYKSTREVLSSEWDHVVLTRTWTGTTTGKWSSKIFVNGVDVTDKLTMQRDSAVIRNASEDILELLIGGNGTQAFAGSIADYKVYNIAITDAATIGEMYTEAMNTVKTTDTIENNLLFDLDLDVEGNTLKGISNAAKGNNSRITYSKNLTAGTLDNGIPYVNLTSTSGTISYIKILDELFEDQDAVTMIMMLKLNSAPSGTNHLFNFTTKDSESSYTTNLTFGTKQVRLRPIGSSPNCDINSFPSTGETGWMQVAFTREWNDGKVKGSVEVRGIGVDGEYIYKDQSLSEQTQTRKTENGQYAVIGLNHVLGENKALDASIAECKIYNRAWTIDELRLRLDEEMQYYPNPNLTEISWKNQDNTEVTDLDGVTELKVSATVSGVVVNPVAYVAVYNSEDSLCAAAPVTVTLNSTNGVNGTIYKLSGSVNGIEPFAAGQTAKLFVWSDGYRPLFQATPLTAE